jgi:hypothetical protein
VSNKKPIGFERFITAVALERFLALKTRTGAGGHRGCQSVEVRFVEQIVKLAGLRLGREEVSLVAA